MARAKTKPFRNHRGVGGVSGRAGSDRAASLGGNNEATDELNRSSPFTGGEVDLPQPLMAEADAGAFGNCQVTFNKEIIGGFNPRNWRLIHPDGIERDIGLEGFSHPDLFTLEFPFSSSILPFGPFTPRVNYKVPVAENPIDHKSGSDDPLRDATTGSLVKPFSIPVSEIEVG